LHNFVTDKIRNTVLYLY